MALQAAQITPSTVFTNPLSQTTLILILDVAEAPSSLHLKRPATSLWVASCLNQSDMVYAFQGLVLGALAFAQGSSLSVVTIFILDATNARLVYDGCYPTSGGL